MAKRMKSNGSGVVPLNSRARNGMIKDVIRELGILEAERNAMSEKIRAFRQKRIKGDLSMKIANFNVAKRYFELEIDDRDEMMACIHEVFNAMGKGEQLDWLKVLERQEQGADARP